MTISDIIKAINAAEQELASGPGVASDGERQELLAATQKLQLAVESPVDIVIRLGLGYHSTAAIRVGMDMGLFTILNAVKEGGISATGLGTKTGGDALLITRIMRILVATGFAKELDEDLYVATSNTGLFAEGSPFQSWITHLAGLTVSLTRLADYFREKGYKNPDDANDGPFQLAHNTKLNYFDWLKNDPEQQIAFNTVMTMARAERGESWFEFFPVESRFSDANPSSPLLVDIGGGRGHDLAALHTRFPNLPGKLILQDLPVVIDDIKELSPIIERVKYDFFTPQPVKGARAYYMRQILHDWPDKQALEILRNIREAMTKESVLLLNENFMPSKNIPLLIAQSDFNMMSFSGQERTESQWKILLEKAGFEVVKVWAPSERLVASATLFEAVRKD